MSWRSPTDWRIAQRKEGVIDARGRRHDAWTPAEVAEAERAAVSELEQARRRWLAQPREQLACADCLQVPPWGDRGVVLRWEPEVVYQCAACRAASPRPVVQRAPWERR